MVEWNNNNNVELTVDCCIFRVRHGMNYILCRVETSTCSFDSRTDEVSRCESLLRATCTNTDTSLLPFLIHTFEEVTQNNPIQ